MSQMVERASKLLKRIARGPTCGAAIAALLMTLPAALTGAQAPRAEAVHERVVFADIHAHPSRFHRANVDRIDARRSRAISAA